MNSVSSTSHGNLSTVLHHRSPLDMNLSSRYNLQGCQVAILAVDGFEQSELFTPLEALEQCGAQVTIVSSSVGTIQGYRHNEKGQSIEATCTFEQALARQFDAFVLPGGVVNADAIRMDAQAQALTKQLLRQQAPLGVICHGAWLLISCDAVAGRTLTSWPSLRDDLRNAGATWVDREVCMDDTWISSRKPDDLPAFCDALCETLSDLRSQGSRSPSSSQHEPQHAAALQR